VRVRVVLEDARTLDLAASTDAIAGPRTNAFTGAYEASVEAQNGAARPSFVRVGRQPVVWGEGRLLGTDDWSAAGRSLDAVRGRLVLGDGAIEALGAVLEDTPALGTATPSAYGELFGLRAEWSLDPLFRIEAYGLARVAQANPAEPTASVLGTIQGQTYAGALRLWGEGRGRGQGEAVIWKWGAEAAYELGHVDLLGEKRAAWAAAGHVACTFDTVAVKPTLGAGGAYASGDDARPGATYRGFDPLLADAHAWHGAMDVFAWSNEAEVSGRASITPFTDGSAAIEYRYARMAQASGAWQSGYGETIGQNTANLSADLGHEIDAQVGWSPWSGVDVTAAYSVLFLGEGARAIVGPAAAQVSHFAFAQASLKL
jgi:hypothetical protein